jgi:hypothetical protein
MRNFGSETAGGKTRHAGAEKSDIGFGQEDPMRQTGLVEIKVDYGVCDALAPARRTENTISARG